MIHQIVQQYLERLPNSINMGFNGVGGISKTQFWKIVLFML